ncbi:TPA: hypothetical protein RXO57_001384 [Escherichia coli]|nr:hypothetical protein [Escherichia coli]HDX3868941.1 hypothetical protein [Escherichia coli]HEA8326587.1 hypothetical protein [Escherichia coli]HEA8452167.1 hypothetical protein [Escherichia coli]HEA8551811.1 hypothetical protein [Escherichia coli]
MFNRPNRNDVDDGVQDIQNDVNQLADSLESVLKSWGSVGTAAAVGIFIGALLSMRKS